LSDIQTSAEVPKQHPMHRITIPQNCTGYEAAQLCHMLTFAVLANKPLDFTTFVKEKGIERLFVQL
jgi:hypothetical protein